MLTPAELEEAIPAIIKDVCSDLVLSEVLLAMGNAAHGQPSDPSDPWKDVDALAALGPEAEPLRNSAARNVPATVVMMIVPEAPPGAPPITAEMTPEAVEVAPVMVSPTVQPATLVL